jgi:hypothetical protein
VHGAVELPIDRQAGALIRMLCGQRLVEVHTNPRIISRDVAKS